MLNVTHQYLQNLLVWFLNTYYITYTDRYPFSDFPQFNQAQSLPALGFPQDIFRKSGHTDAFLFKMHAYNTI